LAVQKSIGSHVILLIGYNEDKQTFTFVNTWGKKWGEEGLGTITYNYVLNPYIIGDFAIITYEGY